MQDQPLYAVSQWSTPHNSVMEDIEQIARTGGKGIGLMMTKFKESEDEAVLEAMDKHGLKATFCTPQLHTMLPIQFLGANQELDPKVRTEIICENIPRLAKFKPELVVIGPGTSGDPLNPAGPLEPVAEGLAQIADVAAEYGLKIGFELLAERRGSPLHSLPLIVDFIDQVGRSNVGVFFDIFHSWCEPDLHSRLRKYIDCIWGVHVNDVRVEERSGMDRELPGHGRGVAPDILATLIDAGYNGWYELEVFSDDGTYGNKFPDSYWLMPHEEYLRKSKEAFDQSFAKAKEIVAAGKAK